MASVINYEVIQVDRLLSEVKSQLLSENQAVPQD